MHSELAPSCSMQEISLPDDITHSSDADIRKLHSRIISWLNYRQTQSAKVQAKALYLKDALAKRFARLEFEFSGEKWRVQAAATRDKESIRIQQELLPVEAVCQALKIEVEKLDRRAQVVSRDLSWRLGEMRL